VIRRYPTQGQILLSLSRGAVITVEHINEPPSNVRTIYKLSSTGRTISSDMVDILLANKLIKPNGDALFGRSQTFSFRRSTDVVPDDAE
jgi:hypothetical protein